LFLLFLHGLGMENRWAGQSERCRLPSILGGARKTYKNENNGPKLLGNSGPFESGVNS
jgi:hypothetical protein